MIMNIGLWRDANKDGGLGVCCVTFVTSNECHNKLLRVTRDTRWWQKPSRPLIGQCLASLASDWLVSVLWHLTPHHQMRDLRRGPWEGGTESLSVGLVTQIRKCPVTGQCVGPHAPHTSWLTLVTNQVTRWRINISEARDNTGIQIILGE